MIELPVCPVYVRTVSGRARLGESTGDSCKKEHTRELLKGAHACAPFLWCFGALY